MFELVEQQPSHLACPDVLNLSLGESRGPGSRPGVQFVWCCPPLPPQGLLC